jgi:hypothetical protein
VVNRRHLSLSQRGNSFMQSLLSLSLENFQVERFYQEFSQLRE